MLIKKKLPDQNEKKTLSATFLYIYETIDIILDPPFISLPTTFNTVGARGTYVQYILREARMYLLKKLFKRILSFMIFFFV